MNYNAKNLIKIAIDEIDKKHIDNKARMNSNLNDALRNKYNKVGKNEEKYIEVLRYNIIYYKSIIKKLELIVEMWIEHAIISNISSVEKSIDNITNSAKEYVNKAMNDDNSSLNEKDKKKFLSYDRSTGLERIEKIENDYKILNLYKDILSMMIKEISSHPDKYSDILSMSIEQAKIDIMNHVFSIINDVLFSEDIEEINFTDEALVEDDELNSSNIRDDEKCMSFKKYVSMISTPEILVRINDVFRDSIDIENIEEKDAYLFTTEYKDIVSCAVLLMDYVSTENRALLFNTFRLFVTGNASETEFVETLDRIVVDNTFIDKRTWLECQKIVKSNFNMENNNFFGSKNSEDKGLSIEDRVKITESLTDKMTVDECLSYLEYSTVSYDDEDSSNFKNKIRSGLFKFSDKLKFKKEYDDNEYYDEFEEYDEDYEEYDEEEYDDYDIEENQKVGFKSKLKNFFTRNKEDSDYYDYDDEDYEDDFDEYIGSEIHQGDEEIQDKNAVAILMMNEKNKLKDTKDLEKEINELIKERKLAEEINKSGVNGYLHKDIVFDTPKYEDDESIHDDAKIDKIMSSDINQIDAMFSSENSVNKEIYDHLDEQKISNEVDSMFYELSKNDEIIEENPMFENTDKVIEPEINNENTYEAYESDKNTDVVYENLDNELERLDEIVEVEIASKDKNEGNESDYIVEKVHDDKVLENMNEDIDGEELDQIFEELENLKAMKTDFDSSKYNISGNDYSTIKLGKDKSVFEPLVNEEDDFEEDYEYEDKESILKVGASKLNDVKDNIGSKLSNIIEERKQKKEEEEYADETTIYPKKKIIRDGIIIVILVVAVFFAYAITIKNFTKPSVQETNISAKKVQSVKNKAEGSDNNSGVDNEELNKETTKITQKTESEREKDEIEAQASQLDREAEQYKAGKGIYYTIFVGATKSEDSAQSVSNNFNNRGVNSKVVRNGGYYMLKVGEYFNINDAYAQSSKISAKGIQNYVASQNKYYDLKIEALKVRAPKLSAEQLKTDYNDLKNQISSTGKNQQYIMNLDEVYNEALKAKQ